jgi:hypothetical protein
MPLEGTARVAARAGALLCPTSGQLRLFLQLAAAPLPGLILGPWPALLNAYTPPNRRRAARLPRLLCPGVLRAAQGGGTDVPHSHTASRWNNTPQTLRICAMLSALKLMTSSARSPHEAPRPRLRHTKARAVVLDGVVILRGAAWCVPAPRRNDGCT